MTERKSFSRRTIINDEDEHNAFRYFTKGKWKSMDNLDFMRRNVMADILNEMIVFSLFETTQHINGLFSSVRRKYNQKASMINRKRREMGAESLIMLQDDVEGKGWVQSILNELRSLGLIEYVQKDLTTDSIGGYYSFTEIGIDWIVNYAKDNLDALYLDVFNFFDENFQFIIFHYLLNRAEKDHPDIDVILFAITISNRVSDTIRMIQSYTKKMASNDDEVNDEQVKIDVTNRIRRLKETNIISLHKQDNDIAVVIRDNIIKQTIAIKLNELREFIVLIRDRNIIAIEEDPPLSDRAVLTRLGQHVQLSVKVDLGNNPQIMLDATTNLDNPPLPIRHIARLERDARATPRKVVLPSKSPQVVNYFKNKVKLPFIIVLWIVISIIFVVGGFGMQDVPFLLGSLISAGIGSITFVVVYYVSALKK